MLALLAFSTMTVAAFATAYTWVGGSSGDWDDAAEWDESGYPASLCDTALIDTDATVDFSNECIESLTIDQVDVTITGTGTLKAGKVTINGPSVISQSSTATLQTATTACTQC